MATLTRRVHPNYVEQYASVVYCQSSREELPFDPHVSQIVTVSLVRAEFLEG